MARHIHDLLEELARPRRSVRRWLLATTHLMALTAGFAGCLLWMGGVMGLMGDNLAKLRQAVVDRQPKVVVTTANQAWNESRQAEKTRQRMLVGKVKMSEARAK